MKVNVTKIGAARSQLIEAINLFFEERDPVSIHTLVGASIQILNDHITDIGDVWDNNLIHHYNTIYINDDSRKIWNSKINEAKNFFKHADRDLREGKISIEFETDLNNFSIFEAIRCLKVVEGEDYVFSIEFSTFIAWLCLKYPNLLKAGDDSFLKMPGAEDFSVMRLKDWGELIRLAKRNAIS